MGRRLGTLDHLLRGVVKVARQNAAHERQQQRRMEGMQARATERAIVRAEREAARIAERDRIERDRQAALRRKADDQQAQLAAWKLEYDEHVQRDRELLSIANESPEIEGRRELFASLLEPREFQPPPFTPPPPAAPNWNAFQTMQARRLEEVERQVNALKPRLGVPYFFVASGGVVIALGLLVAAGGGAAGAVLAVFLLGALVLGVGLALRSSMATSQRSVARAKLMIPVERDLEKEKGVALRAAERETTARVALARRRHEEQVEQMRAAFLGEELQRIGGVQALLDGDIRRMTEELASLFPLELPVACPCQPHVVDAHTVELDIELPEANVLQANEAKLLASGKVTYKEKSTKRQRDEYQRLVAGIIIRHACEALLNAPTCQTVRARGCRGGIDPATGKPLRTTLIEATIDVPALEPLVMESIDAAAALKNFKHHLMLEA